MSEALEPIDPEAAAAALGIESSSPFAPIAEGWEHQVWRFVDTTGRALALRIYRKDTELEAALVAARNESTAIRIASSAGLPVPDICAEGVYAGRPAAIHTWLPGETVAETMRQQPMKARQLGRALGRLQAQLHALPGEGLGGLEDRDWEAMLDDEALIAAVRAEPRREPRFCHLDFHPLNVLVTGTTISGLLDFRHAAAGDIRVDLGLTWTMLTAPPLPPRYPGRVARMLLRRMAAGWRDGYRDAAGEFPLTPLFQAIGIALYRNEFTRASREDRGWATERDIARLSGLLEERKRDLNIP